MCLILSDKGGGPADPTTDHPDQSSTGVSTATVRVALGRRAGSVGWEARNAAALDSRIPPHSPTFSFPCPMPSPPKMTARASHTGGGGSSVGSGGSDSSNGRRIDGGRNHGGGV